jgi:hypothetical protein
MKAYFIGSRQLLLEDGDVAAADAAVADQEGGACECADTVLITDHYECTWRALIEAAEKAFA